MSLMLSHLLSGRNVAVKAAVFQEIKERFELSKMQEIIRIKILEITHLLEIREIVA
jgi:hypothetical protein